MGLTRSGVAVIVTLGVALLLAPLLYFVWRNFSFMRPVGISSSGTLPSGPLISHKLRRVGKDVEMTITIDNSASSGAVTGLTISRLSLAGKAPVKIPIVGSVPAHTKADVVACFAGVPRGTANFDMDVDYALSGGSGGGESGGEMIDVP